MTSFTSTLTQTKSSISNTPKNKTILYIDVDDTLISNCTGYTYDLRPGVVTQISLLTKLFQCKWLTHWNKKALAEMWDLLYAYQLRDIDYADWKNINRIDKAVYVIERDQPFWWLEDPLSTGNLKELKAANLFDRYIPVEPKGLWGFTRALQELFRRAGITDKQIKDIGGKPQWFREPLSKDYFDFTYSD
jgi:hypothetical protein